MRELTAAQVAALANPAKEVVWLFNVQYGPPTGEWVATKYWSLRDTTFGVQSYLGKILKGSFPGISASSAHTELGKIVATTTRFSAVTDTIGSYFEGNGCLITLVVNGEEIRSWRMEVSTCLPDAHGALQFDCVDFLQPYMEGVWPRTALVKELDNTATCPDDTCVPWTWGPAYLPCQFVQVEGERYYLLGKTPTAPAYTPVYEVSTPRSKRGGGPGSRYSTADISGMTSVTVVRNAEATGTVIIADSSGYTVMGVASYELTLPREAVGLVLAGTDWLLGTSTPNDYLIDATAGAQAVDLTGVTGAVLVAKTDTSANAVTISDSRGYTIMGSASYVLTAARETVNLYLYGSNWIVTTSNTSVAHSNFPMFGDIVVNLGYADKITYFKSESSPYTITIRPASGHTIMGGSEYVVSTQWEAVSLIRQGTDWIIAPLAENMLFIDHTYSMPITTKTIGEWDYTLFQPLIADGNQGLWVEGSGFSALPTKYSLRTATAAQADNAELFTAFFEQLYIPSMWLDGAGFATSDGFILSGGWSVRQKRDAALASLLEQAGAVMAVEDKVYIRPRSATSQYTVSSANILRQGLGRESTFRYTPVRQTEIDSGTVGYQISSEPADALIPVTVPIDATSVAPAPGIVAMPLVHDQDVARKLMRSLVQRRHGAIAELRWESCLGGATAGECAVALQPDDVVTVNHTIYSEGSTFDALIDTITFAREGHLEIRARRLARLDDYLSWLPGAPVVAGQPQQLAATMYSYEESRLAAEIAATYLTIALAAASYEPKVSRFLIDATAGDQAVDLAGLAEALIIKLDATVNTVTIADTGGNTVMGAANKVLTTQRQASRLLLAGSDWLEF